MRRLAASLAATLLALAPLSATAQDGGGDTGAASACQELSAKMGEVSEDEAVATYQELLACDKKDAEGQFTMYLKAAGTLDNVVALSLAAIDGKVFMPVWRIFDGIKDYGMRDEVAQGIGAACGEHPGVVAFLRGGYYPLKGTEYARWKDGLIACTDPGLEEWIATSVSKPPEIPFDEKYQLMLDVWIGKKGAEALPAFVEAAKAAAEKGPFDTLLTKMNEAVQPKGFGEEMSAADRDKLTAALVSVAEGVPTDKAVDVADKLFNAGAETEAAKLLPTIYKDVVQEDGRLLYGVAAIESCDKEAVLHWTTATDPGKRWSILGDAESTLRGYKARLKCDAGEWPVLATPTPMADEDAVKAWAEALGADLEKKNDKVKLRQEKAVVLD